MNPSPSGQSAAKLGTLLQAAPFIGLFATIAMMVSTFTTLAE